jgi:tetraacyldisaccharide 4'-kinase
MRIFYFLLFPISILYGVVTWVRNKLFDWGIKEEFKISFPAINVGNLSVGGTGKTPHILLFNEWLAGEKKIFIISRGYGRKTRGLLWANECSTAASIGDEPMLFHQAIPKPTVIVSEKRRVAVDALIQLKETDCLLLLDDAYQHRHVKAGLNMVLTDYNQPYFKDFMLPTGQLREFRSSINRADLVLVTKCPNDFEKIDKSYFYRRIKKPIDSIFFSKIDYPNIEPLFDFKLPKTIERIVLVSGIANPKPLVQHLSKNYSLKTVIFPDHHAFTLQDIERIHEIFGKFASDKTIILTTEKDAVRLDKFVQDGKLENYPWCIQKITLKIDREQELKDKIIAYVRKV